MRGRVPQHHPAVVVAPDAGREGLAIGAEGHALSAALGHGERDVRQPLARGRVPQDHAAGSRFGGAAEVEAGGEGLAVGAEGHAPDAALTHEDGVIRTALACGRIPQHHARVARDAVAGGEGLAVGAEGDAAGKAHTHAERVVGQALARGHVPEHHAANSARPAEPGGEGLAVGAEPHAGDEAFDDGEWCVPQAFAPGHVPQHDTAGDGPVSGGEGLAVGAERHAPDAGLLDGEWFLDQAFTRGHVPEHHAATSVAVTDTDEPGGEGLAVGSNT